ncbi:hypothetical protein OAO87_03525 [bacterium]|nr:hypothetical protein [bacterium]
MPARVAIPAVCKCTDLIGNATAIASPLRCRNFISPTPPPRLQLHSSVFGLRVSRRCASPPYLPPRQTAPRLALIAATEAVARASLRK